MSEAAFHMRESRDPAAGAFDHAGALSFTAMLAAFTTAMLEAPGRGWGSVTVLLLLAAFASLLATFVMVERRRARPMLDLSLFRYRRFVGVQLLPVATCLCFVVLLVLLPLRFIGIEGSSESRAGLLMLALSAPMLVVPMAAGMLARHASAGTLSGSGLLMAAVGLVWLGSVPIGNDSTILAPMLLIGIGAGLPWGLMDGLSVSVVPTERAGMATGIFGTVRVAGEGVALAIVNATLAGLIALPGRIGGAAAQRLAIGDAAGAGLKLPQLAHGELGHAYHAAFASLCWILAAITMLCAVAIHRTLASPSPPSGR